MIKLCLFDLDQTLVHTDDLEEIRIAAKNKHDDPAYVAQLSQLFKKTRRNLILRNVPRNIYSADQLTQLRNQFPALKLGVFTRSPRLYANTILELAYPGFHWDIVVAYEDVANTKPFPDGVWLACNRYGLAVNECLLVGDEVVDVRTAYNAGIRVVLDQSHWPKKREPKHWNALNKIPDVFIKHPSFLPSVLNAPEDHLPLLEQLIESPQSNGARLDKINHFFPNITEAHPIYVAGRSFSRYQSLSHRRQWHQLSNQIEVHKESTIFPDEWVLAIRIAVQQYQAALQGSRDVTRQGLTITTVPPRPGRTPRLYYFLDQLQEAHRNDPFTNRFNVLFTKNVLGFRDGVQSNSGEHLNKDQRFTNIGEHLYVDQSNLVRGGCYLVLDDVVTTGASLLYCEQYLKEAGASHVVSFAFAHSIGDN